MRIAFASLALHSLYVAPDILVASYTPPSLVALTVFFRVLLLHPHLISTTTALATLP
jgi:hypothetical protein